VKSLKSWITGFCNEKGTGKTISNNPNNDLDGSGDNPRII